MKKATESAGTAVEKRNGPQLGMKDAGRPLGITVFLVLTALNLIGSLLSMGSIASTGMSIMGAWISGDLLLAYMLFWFGVGAAIIYGIWKRKEWAPDFAIAMLVTQIVLSLGGLLYLDQTLNAAMAQAGNLTREQMASAIEVGKTISYIMTAILFALYAWFIKSFHENHGYFQEKGII